MAERKVSGFSFGLQLLPRSVFLPSFDAELIPALLLRIAATKLRRCL